MYALKNPLKLIILIAIAIGSTALAQTPQKGTSASAKSDQQTNIVPSESIENEVNSESTEIEKTIESDQKSSKKNSRSKRKKPRKGTATIFSNKLYVEFLDKKHFTKAQTAKWAEVCEDFAEKFEIGKGFWQ